MKYLLIILLTLAIVTGPLLAEDVIITIRIPSSFVASFRAGFLEEVPKTDPAATDKQWVKRWIVKQLLKKWFNGLVKIAERQARELVIVDPNGIQ